MRKLIRVVLMSIGLFVVLCISTIAIERTRPRSEILLEFSRCEDTFCFMGIKPGTTSEIDAQTILNNDPQLMVVEVPSGHWAHIQSEPKYGIWLRAVGEPSNITVIDLQFGQTTIDAGGVVTQLDSPCRVETYDSDLAALFYSHVSFVFQINDSRLQIASRLIKITVFGSSIDFCKENSGTFPPIYEWRGFRRYIHNQR